MKALALVAGVGVAAVAVGLIPVGGTAHSVPTQPAPKVDLSAWSADAPKRAPALVFLHHSVGGQLLADPGPSRDLANSIHVSHENGGGLRKLLEGQGYRVHEASYGSKVADNTDLFDWLPNFSQNMDRILATRFNDELLPEAERNEIVLFKSCYPNNRFVGEGTLPGNPAGKELTVANARAALSALLPLFEQRPHVLFVYLTAPPNAPGYPRERLAKLAIQRVLGRQSTAQVLEARARLAREFDSWVVAPTGWLAGYPGRNVVVFDYYDVLTGGQSNFSAYPTDEGMNNHPDRVGQAKAAQQLVGFLNRAVRRAGLSE